MIHKDDKKALHEYVAKINEEQSIYNIDAFFYLGAYEDESIFFMINGQKIYKDTFFDAVNFLDGIKFCIPNLTID